MIFLDPKIYTVKEVTAVNIRLDPDDEPLFISGAWMDFAYTLDYFDPTHNAEFNKTLKI
jgi:hypothetical protein